MGGGIFGAKGNPPSNEALEQISTDYFKLAEPLMKQSQQAVGGILAQGPGQFESLNAANAEALRTGASEAYIPSIQRATEASLRASSDAASRTSEDLTRRGITGTEYNQIIADALQKGYFNASQAAAPYYEKQADALTSFLYGQAGANQGFYRDILSSFYKALTGAPQVGISGLGTAAGVEGGINIANTKAATDLIVGLAQASAQASTQMT
jgi:hypothetical protein